MKFYYNINDMFINIIVFLDVFRIRIEIRRKFIISIYVFI